jgi:putative hydrolase of the HAD superfamily
VFDWGGTITPWHTVDPLAAWMAAAGDPERARRLHEAERAIWGRHLERQQSATMADIFAEAGIEQTGEAAAAFHRWWDPHTYADPDASGLFAALRERGMKVGVLSNTFWPRVEHERIFDRDGLLDLIDAAVYTCEIAWTKPHPEAFRAALDALGVPDPASAVFVGDRLFDDIHGAAAVGMRTVLIPHSEIPGDQYGPVAGEPDAIVQRLGDVLQVVDSWS